MFLFSLPVLVPPSIDVEAFLAGCDTEAAPMVEEDSGASVSSTMIAGAAIVMALGIM